MGLFKAKRDTQQQAEQPEINCQACGRSPDPAADLAEFRQTFEQARDVLYESAAVEVMKFTMKVSIALAALIVLYQMNNHE